MEDSKAACTPGTEAEAKGSKVKREDKGGDGGGCAVDETTLVGRRATLYRRAAASLNYLSQDRLDIGFAVKEIARKMAYPTERDETMIKRILRYLTGRPRACQLFTW